VPELKTGIKDEDGLELSIRLGFGSVGIVNDKRGMYIKRDDVPKLAAKLLEFLTGTPAIKVQVVHHVEDFPDGGVVASWDV